METSFALVEPMNDNLLYRSEEGAAGGGAYLKTPPLHTSGSERPQHHSQAHNPPPTWDGTKQTAKPTARHREVSAASRMTQGMHATLSSARAPDMPGAPRLKERFRRQGLRPGVRRMKRANSNQGPAASVLTSRRLGPVSGPGRRRRSACHRSMFPDMIQLDHQFQGLKLESVK